MKNSLLSPAFRGKGNAEILLIIVLALLSQSGFSQIQLVRDLNSESHLYSTEFGMAQEVNGIVYVPGKNALWKTNGTQAGSVEIKKFTLLHSLFKFNNQLFFVADDGVNGQELWKSNGTSQGTVLVKDLAPGAPSSFPTSFVVANNLMFFIADTPKNGKEVWRTDGTAGGTFLLKDIISGPGPSNPASLVAYKNRLFFTASDGILGYELWTSDGSTNGTKLSKDIRPGKPSSTPQSLVVAGTNLYFNAYTDTYGREVWKSDGTPEGTTLVKDIRPGVNARAPENMLDHNGTLFFRFDDGTGPAFWKSNGTAEGTARAFSIGENGVMDFFHGVVSANGKLYALKGDEMFESDGTQAGTRSFMFVGDFYAGLTMYSFNNIVYLVDGYLNQGEYGQYGSRLSKIQNSVYSDVKTFPGPGLVPTLSFTSSLGLVFSAITNDHKTMLWKSNGTASGTVPFLDLITHNKGSDPTSLVQLAGNVLFVANDSAEVRSLWKMDGTTTQTQLLSRIEPFNMTLSGNRVYFVANEAHLWRSNGTTAGTNLVKKFPTDGQKPMDLTDVNGTLFFSAGDGTGNRELWKSTGAYSGTVRVKDILPGSASSNLVNLTNFNGTLFFSTNSSDYRKPQLWKSDGTETGTTVVLSAFPAQFTYLKEFAVVNTNLFFVASNSTTSLAVYKTDGISTVLVKDFSVSQEPELYSNDIIELKGDGTRLYFQVRDDDGSWDFWTSDGTAAGTKILMDNPPNRYLRLIQSYQGKMFFVSAAVTTHSTQLWATNGTVAGTSMITSLPFMQGTVKSVILDNILYFGGGNNLWRTDGTACGTLMIKTEDGVYLNPPSEPQMIINKDRRIVFTANHPYLGTELFKLEKANAPKSPCTVIATAEEGVAILDEIEKGVMNYPNPFVDHFTLRVNSPDDKSYRASIISINGKQLWNENDLRTNTDYSVGRGLQNGMYLIKLTLDDRTTVTRIVKVN